jgi:phosphatidylinositol alpha-1,6-mannosyltransferase
MQTHAANLYEQCARRTPTRLIALGRQSKVHVLWFFPRAMLAVFGRLITRRADYVLCADAVTLMVLWPVLWVFRPRVAVVVYGLDLVVRNPVYQAWLRVALRRADRVVAISDATARAARERGVDDSRLVVLYPGVSLPDPEPGVAASRSATRRLLGVDESAFVLVTLGRLVRRKGVAWFVSSVLPRLPAGVVYASAGAGPEAKAIEEAASRSGVGDRFRLLGAVDESTRESLMRGADVFVMPNVPVPGDMEGFGLVAIEAALRSTPVVAARMEGIVDAVVDGETGYLCEPMNASEFIERLVALDNDRASLASFSDRAAEVAREWFSVDTMDAGFAAAFDIPSAAASRR